MARRKEEILKDLAEAVLNMDENLAVRTANEAIEVGLAPYDAISNGLIAGMNKAGDMYEREEYFVPEIFLCSDAMYAGLEVLKPYLAESDNQRSGRVVLGVVKGDTHDIGKSIVRIMLEAAGFDVTDLGRNVAYTDFVDAAVESNADIIGLSSLMTTAMTGMGDVITILNQRELRQRFKVVIGGAPTSVAFARKIEADGYAPNASAAVTLLRSLTQQSEDKQWHR